MNTNAIAIGGAVVSGLALIVAGYGAYKMHKASKNLNAAVEDLSDNIVVDISDAVIEQATNKAVEKAADHAAQLAVASIKHEFDDEIRATVKDAVVKEKETLKSEIKEQIKKKVGYIDISDVQEEVKNEAKSEAMEKFKADLDAIVSSHNQELNSIKDIYSSIAKTMKGAAS